jgi:hypothetical protein
MSGGMGSTAFWYPRGNNIYKTTNNGANWTTHYTGTQALWGMDFVTFGGCPSGWAVGAAGTVLKMANDSLVAVQNQESQIPTSYKLEQNYPNPFNPSTLISFSIPKADKVKLVVYDLLGREVSTLVDQYMQAGKYTQEFDGTRIASGVYFYTLKVNDFTETRKMLLVK